MSDGQYLYDYASSKNLSLGAASVSTSLPANTELLGVCTVGAGHYRTGAGSATAVATDPLITTSSGVVVIRIPAGHDTIAVIQDGASTGNFTIWRLFED